MKPLAVLDFETDPFEYGNCPLPFAWGVYTAETYTDLWDEQSCIDRLIIFLAALKEPHIIYAHNGGKFDFWYLLPFLSKEMRIINGRIVKAFIGKHEIRDSFSIMPFALSKYKKDEIDYALMHRDCRNLHRPEIMKYLKQDCSSLFELVTEFAKTFGDNLTIGGTSMKAIKKKHPFSCGNATYDKKLRAAYYFGGRNQCFEAGILKGKWKIWDINSSYPHTMESMLHPVGTGVEVSKWIEPDTCFVMAEGWNYGAFPTRTKTNGLDFTVPYGTFCTTIHEYNAALETGAFKVKRIHKTYGFEKRSSFSDFVTYFYDSRKMAIQNKDKIHDLFYKFIMNSGYGKFAQNPRNYFDWQILPYELGRPTEQCPVCLPDGNTKPEPDCEHCLGDGYKWSPSYTHHGKYTIFKSPLTARRYFNIATGASITGGARANLLRGIKAAKRPIYCDTDSIICEELHAGPGVELHNEKLGAWKLEGTGELAAIVGKKLYAIFTSDETQLIRAGLNQEQRDAVRSKHEGRNYWCIKKANKGVRSTGNEILRAARGETITCVNPVPAFKLDGTYEFTTRKIRITAKC